MRILFVHEKCGFFGGVEQNVRDTALGLAGRGHTCELAFGETARFAAEYRTAFDAVHPCTELAPAGAAEPPASAGPLAAIVERARPDVVYLHKSLGLDYAALKQEARTVRMVHDHDLCCPRRHKYYTHNGRVCKSAAGWRCWADGAFLERAPGSFGGVRFAGIGGKLAEMRRNRYLDALLVGSRFMRGELLQNGFPPGRVHIVPPIVRRRNTSATEVPEDPHVLYVGQLIRGKGVDLLLRALSRLTIDFHATVVGEGNARAGLEELATELRLEERVRFAGWVPNDRLDEHYASARVVAVPSRWPEPFGMIGLEAMHQARPVVGFAVGGIPDWLDHGRTGLLAPEQDVPALAAALERLLTDRVTAARYGRAGYERVHDQFTFDGYLDRLEQRLLPERAGSSPAETPNNAAHG